MPLHFHGFYDRVLRRKFIMINSELEPYIQGQTCARLKLPKGIINVMNPNRLLVSLFAEEIMLA
jgi:hypothetical protein